MTVTAAQLQDAVDAARRMKSALDSHLGVLRMRVKRLSEEGKQIPSQNNFFLYVTGPQGLIRIQQDSAFLVEAVLVVEPQQRNPFSAFSTPFYELALKDANAGRDLTGGFHAVYTDNPLTEEDTDLVPGGLFVPITGVVNPFLNKVPNVDDWKTTKAEYLLPRGSVVRPTFRSSGTFEVGGATPNPAVILAGYKVF